ACLRRPLSVSCSSFKCPRAPLSLPPFPTRRSSDLQASRATSCSAASLGIVPSVPSQNLALTWAMPTSPMLSRCASSSARPASSLITWLIMSAHLRSAVSKRSRTAGSFAKSDSKTSRKVPRCSATYPKYALNDPLPVFVRRAERHPDRFDQLLHALVEQREIEILLAREVLVEDGFADPGAIGDLVHRRRVVAAGDEDLPGCVKQLAAARQPGQA